MVLPPMQHAAAPGVPNLVPGPDVIVGDVEDVAQFDPAVGTQVGLAIGTDSCNNGDQPVDWFALPQTDHPVVPQNLYRMSGGATNDARFEQIGQSWMKHTFLALEESICGTCNTSGCQTGSHLCPGCSDPYTSGLNGDQEASARAPGLTLSLVLFRRLPMITAAIVTMACRTESWWRRVI